MPDKIGLLIFQYAAQIRKYRNQIMAQMEDVAGLTERDLAILEFVAIRGEVTFSEVTRELNLEGMPKSSASSISQAISALYANRKLVNKRPNPEDQRQPIISLTDKGNDVNNRVQQTRRNLLNKVIESMELTENERQTLEKAYKKGIKNFDKLLNQTTTSKI